MITEIAGFKVGVEFLTARGRIDVVLSAPDRFYIFELKINKDANEAMRQIKEKEYYQMFVNKGKQVTLVGISFDTVKR